MEVNTDVMYNNLILMHVSKKGIKKCNIVSKIDLIILS